MTKVPKSAQAMVATLVRTIFAQPDAASVWAQHGRVVDQLRERFANAAELLEDAAPDVLAFSGFPKEFHADLDRRRERGSSPITSTPRPRWFVRRAV